MLREQAVRNRLRAATAAAHGRVDAIFSCFDLGRREHYALFLQAQAAALLPLEQALEAGAAPRLPVDWSTRRRGPALLADLRALGVPEPVCDELAPIEGDAAALGTLYVLEGSRLGGALLSRSVPVGFASAFLTPGSSTHWRELLDVLERTLATPDAQREASAAAEVAFDLFEDCGRIFTLRIA